MLTFASPAIFFWVATKFYFLYVGWKSRVDSALHKCWLVMAVEVVGVPLAQYVFPAAFQSGAIAWLLIYALVAWAMLSIYDKSKEPAAWKGFLAYYASSALCMVYILLDSFGLYFAGLMWVLSSSLVCVFIYLTVIVHIRARQLSHVGAYHK
tara:strand:+ start:717 stop:1172 length:456 start_codon:yes stop_codon:yes gene_type:complete